MNVKRIIIPTITMVVIASQLMGCAAVSKSELLTLLEQGENIEIEVASPINQEQGEEQTLDWIQLDQLQTVPELRKEIDDIFKIVHQSNTKNGVFYVDLEGNQNGNNTLYNTFMNNKFRNYWEDETTLLKVADAALNTYVDVEPDQEAKAVYMAMNGYFNLLADATPGYSNPDSTLNRLEAMAALFKAEHPVTDTLAADKEFNTAVDSANKNPNTIYASNLSEQSYLDIESGSLDNMTANGTITRGEFVYMLVQQYFKSDYDTVDLKAECYSDTKNGGDIATKQKFIENGTEKKYWQSYELTYALQNPDKGCPERMYKALIVAFDKGIIQDTDSCWDEAVTKASFMEMLTNTYSALPTITDSERGLIAQLEVNLTDKSTQEKTSVDSTGADVTIDEGDYVEPTMEEIEAEQTTNLSEIDEAMEQAKQDMKKFLEAGIISQEDYDAAMENLNKGPQIGNNNTQTKPSQSAAEEAIAKQYEENAKKALAEMSSEGTGDNRTNIEYGQGDYTGLEHIRIN